MRAPESPNERFLILESKVSCDTEPQISLVGLLVILLNKAKKRRKEKSNLGELVENFYFPSHNATKSIEIVSRST